MLKKINFDYDFNYRFNGKYLFDSSKFIEDLKIQIGEENFLALKKQEDFIGDGNSVVVNVLKRLVTGLVGYPITPSTPIAEGMAKAYSDGFVNVYGEKIFYFQPESELGAMAFLEGAASQGGRFADNTSSQGLTYKFKNMFSIAGKRLPALMTLQTREVNKGGLSIHNSHADLYAARGTGWVLLMSSNNQEMHYLIPLVCKAIEQRQVMLPAIIAGEGFLKSHSIENVKVLSDEFLKYFVGSPNRMFQTDFENPVLMGTFTDINVTMPTQVKQDYALKNVKKYVKAVMDIANKILGTNIDVVENYFTEDAEFVVVMMGAGAETMKEVVDYYRSKGVLVGLVRPVLFYPSCTEEIAFGIQSAKVITVLEKVAQANEKFLFKDVNEAANFVNVTPKIVSGVYGLGSQNFSIEDCIGIIENMLSQKPKNNFYVGISGINSITPVKKEDFKEKETGITFVGIGAEGVKTSQETLAKIIAKSGKYVQTSAKYGASRKGGMVVMSLRVSDFPIRNCSNLTKIEILGVFNDKYLIDDSLVPFLKSIKNGGYLLVNTAKDVENLMKSVSANIKNILNDNKFNLIIFDATSAVFSVLKKNLPGTPMLGIINHFVKILPEDKFLSIFKEELLQKFGDKKPQVVEKNLSLLNIPFTSIPSSDKLEIRDANTTTDNLNKISTPKKLKFYIDKVEYSTDDELATIDFPNLYGEKYFDRFVNKVLIPVQNGGDIPWEDFLNIIPGKTSKFNKTNLIGSELPVFQAEKCVNCGLCVIGCPDNALRTTILKSEDFLKLPDSVKKLFQKLNYKRFTGKTSEEDRELFFNINVDSDYCKSCGVCVKNCKFGALILKNKNDVNFTSDFTPQSIKDLDISTSLASEVNESKILQKVMLKYSGQKFLPGGHSLCPGCGEGVIENLVFTAAEMVRENPKIIEETYKSLPQLIQRFHAKGIQHMIENSFYIYTINATGCAEVSCLSNPFNSRVYPSGHFGFGTASAAALGTRISLFSAFRNYYIDKLTKVIVFGGDGAFYDIGNQGLNFALGENQDITWVIYNNEAYMNTGFQKSGASRFGSNKTTSPYGLELKGKEDFHKELVAQAIAIPGVYVARLSIHDPIYSLKILKEAIAYKGPSIIEFFSTCPTGQGLMNDDLTFDISKMMVESRAWPILVRKPYNGIDITANPDYESIYPNPKKVKGEVKNPASFRDIVTLMAQFAGDKKTIDEIVRVNEKQNIYRWNWLQYLSGVSDKLLSESDIIKMANER